MQTYRIIDLLFAVKHQEGVYISSWGLFKCINSGKVDVSVEGIDEFVINRDISFARVALCENMMFTENSLMCMDKMYENAYIFSRGNKDAFNFLSAYLFYTHAIRRQVLWIHSATIADQERGILFLGPSGVGKTTQAERWAQYRGATIINGDVGFVQRRAEGDYLAWGTPWHGSSPYCVNTSVPLKALVVLKQAPYNALRELTGFEKVSEVSGNVFYPTWLEDGMELGLETLNHLLTDLPVYRLDNRADQEAVDLLARELERL